MKTFILRSLVYTLFTLTAASLTDAQAPSSALASGQAFLEQKRPEAALVEFKKAMTESPGTHEGYFYAAVASYRLGDLAGAEEYAKAALEKAPDAETARIQEMLGVIGERQRFEKLEREADEAMAAGLRAKAAELYRKAHELFPKEGRPGLKAASLYADRLKKLLDAAILWQQIAAEADEASRAEARTELSNRSLELDKLMKGELYAAQTVRRKDATQILERLCAAFPDRIDVHVEAADFYADQEEDEKAAEHLMRASALGAEAITVQFRQHLIRRLGKKEGSPRLVTFIEEAFGTEVLEKMRQTPTFYFQMHGPSSDKIALAQEAAAHRHAWAMCMLGEFYAEGNSMGLGKDEKGEAARWFQKAHDLGYPEATRKLGACYWYGNGVPEDPSKARVLFQQAAALEEPVAFWYLGVIEMKKGNEAGAEKFWRQGVDRQDMLSLTDVGKLYRKKGRYEEAITLARGVQTNTSAFIKGCVMVELGIALRDASPPLKNLAEARRCLEEAMELGASHAKAELAKLP